MDSRRDSRGAAAAGRSVCPNRLARLFQTRRVCRSDRRNPQAPLRGRTRRRDAAVPRRFEPPYASRRKRMAILYGYGAPVVRSRHQSMNGATPYDCTSASGCRALPSRRRTAPDWDRSRSAREALLYRLPAPCEPLAQEDETERAIRTALLPEHLLQVGRKRRERRPVALARISARAGDDFIQLREDQATRTPHGPRGLQAFVRNPDVGRMRRGQRERVERGHVDDNGLHIGGRPHFERLVVARLLPELATQVIEGDDRGVGWASDWWRSCWRLDIRFQRSTKAPSAPGVLAAAERTAEIRT